MVSLALLAHKGLRVLLGLKALLGLREQNQLRLSISLQLLEINSILMVPKHQN